MALIAMAAVIPTAIIIALAIVCSYDSNSNSIGDSIIVIVFNYVNVCKSTKINASHSGHSDYYIT